MQGLHYPLAVSRATLVPDEYRSKVPTKGWKHKYKYKSESGGMRSLKPKAGPRGTYIQI